MTNGDRIRQMSNEELAKYINSGSACNMCIHEDYYLCTGKCKEGIKAYLDMEVEVCNEFAKRF